MKAFQTANESAREASLTATDAARYAAELGDRKFRLERSRAGNSRFVYRSTAWRLQAKYGGEVVNYRPRGGWKGGGK